MSRIKRYNPETGAWEYADAALVAGGGGITNIEDLLEKEVDVLPLTELPEMEFYSDFRCYGTTIVQPAEVVIGETYYVFWDEQPVWTCKAQGGIIIDGNEIIVIGNGAAITNSGLTGNNEPFIIGVPSDLSGFIFLSTVDTEPKIHDVRIYRVENIIDDRVEAYLEDALGGDY